MRRNVLIFIAAVVAVSVLFFFLIFKPQATKIDATRADADAAEAKTGQLRAELKRLQELQRNAPKLREEATILDAAMPNDPQLAQFILQVQESATASGIDWLSIAPVPPAASTQPGVSEVVVAMSVEGGYFQVQDFLVRLETLPRAVKIGAVTLAPGGDEESAPGGSPDLAASLQMRLFVSSASSAPPATGTPPA